MKLNVMDSTGSMVIAHLRHVRHVQVDIMDPACPKILILDAKRKKILSLEYTTELKAQKAMTDCAETIRKYEALKMSSHDPVTLPPLAAFELPSIRMEAIDV